MDPFQLSPPKQSILKVKIIQGLLFLCCFVIPHSSFSQDWIGFNADNFAGIHRMQTQPASIVGGPYKLDVNIVSADLLGLNAEFFSNIQYAKDLNDLEKNTFLDIFKKDKEEYLVTGNVMLPSFTYQLNEKSAIGFSAKARAVFFAKGSDIDLNNLILNDFELEEFFGTLFNNSFVTTRYNTWTEYNFTYARELINDADRAFRIGVTPKLLIAQGAGYISIDQLSFELENSDIINDLSGEVRFGYNEGLDETLNGNGIKLFGKASFGLNIGVEYEIKDSEVITDPNDRRYNPGYKFRFGLSYSDFGTLKFEKAEKSSDYTLDVDNFSLNSLRDVESIDALADTLSAYFSKSGNSSDFEMQLPSSLRLQIDYKLKRFFYLNLSTVIATVGKDRDIAETRNLNLFTLSLRYEKPKFGVGLPLSYNEAVDFNVGTTVRWGPVVLGSGNSISGLFTGSSQFTNLFFAFKVPILKKEFRKKKGE